jgi:hypothetical protein
VCPGGFSFSFAREVPRLDFALCLGAHSMRDEDLFGNLLSRELAKERGDDWAMPYSDYLPDARGTWTCRVGRQPSQARHYVDDEKEVRGLPTYNDVVYFSCSLLFL